MERAVVVVRALAAKRPASYLPRQGLLDAISSVGIRIEPPDAFLGAADLSALMFEVARRDPDFLISSEAGSGKGFRYFPGGVGKPRVRAAIMMTTAATTTSTIAATVAAPDEPTPVPALPPLTPIAPITATEPQPHRMPLLDAIVAVAPTAPQQPAPPRWDLT
jgi:hypothetical protein